jgi:hypothetical protein
MNDDIEAQIKNILVSQLVEADIKVIKESIRNNDTSYLHDVLYEMYDRYSMQKIVDEFNEAKAFTERLSQ